MEAGYSWAARWTPLPLWSTEIVLVPAAFIAAGVWFYQGPSRDLGGWLIVLGGSLCYLAMAELRHRYTVSGSIIDMYVQGDAAGASLGTYTANSQASGQRAGHMAEDATASATPRGMAMHAEGSGGGWFLFNLGKRRKATSQNRSSTDLKNAGGGRAGEGGSGTTYAEPGA